MRLELEPQRYLYKCVERIEQCLRERMEWIEQYLRECMEWIERCLNETASLVEGITPMPNMDRCLLEHHNELISGLKQELLEVSHNISSIDGDTWA